MENIHSADSIELTEASKKKVNVPVKKPLVLSSQRYGKILANINQNKIIEKEVDEEQKYKEYLKKGSDDMVATWSGSFKRNQEQKLAERNEGIEEKIRKEQKEYQKIKENDEQVRREKIAQAEKFIQQLKPGPKDLQRAAIQSEVLKARAIQLSINEEFEKSLRRKTAAEHLHFERQAMPWIEQEQKRMVERQQSNNQYKAELLQTIKDNSKRRTEQSKQFIREQQAVRDETDHEIKNQIERERLMQDKKRAALRRNALEAMQMVEQRRLRSCIENDIEDKLAAVYNTGKHNIELQKRAQEQQARLDHLQQNELNAQKLISVQANIKATEEERLKRDISSIQLKFTAQEQEKIKKDKQQKLARIERYMNEMHAQKEAKERRMAEHRLEIANRHKNEEVNAAFNEVERKERGRKAVEHTTAIKEQITQRQQVEKLDKEFEKKCSMSNYEREHKYFFDYANNLVANAVAKDRPVYPFVKAIERYKNENSIDINRQVPRHLVSHLQIGVLTPKEECTTGGGGGEPISNANDCNSNSKSEMSEQRRYCIAELRHLNQFAP